jgi:hypothetical protein
LPAVLADPISQGLGISRTAFYAAFSRSRLLTTALGPAVGLAIDTRGGRGITGAIQSVMAAGLPLVALILALSAVNVCAQE